MPSRELPVGSSDYEPVRKPYKKEPTGIVVSTVEQVKTLSYLHGLPADREKSRPEIQALINLSRVERLFFLDDENGYSNFGLCLAVALDKYEQHLIDVTRGKVPPDQVQGLMIDIEGLPATQKTTVSKEVKKAVTAFCARMLEKRSLTVRHLYQMWDDHEIKFSNPTAWSNRAHLIGRIGFEYQQLLSAAPFAIELWKSKPVDDPDPDEFMWGTNRLRELDLVYEFNTIPQQGPLIAIADGLNGTFIRAGSTVVETRSYGTNFLNNFRYNFVEQGLLQPNQLQFVLGAFSSDTTIRDFYALHRTLLRHVTSIAEANGINKAFGIADFDSWDQVMEARQGGSIEMVEFAQTRVHALRKLAIEYGYYDVMPPMMRRVLLGDRVNTEELPPEIKREVDFMHNVLGIKKHLAALITCFRYSEAVILMDVPMPIEDTSAGIVVPKLENYIIGYTTAPIEDSQISLLDQDFIRQELHKHSKYLKLTR